MKPSRVLVRRVAAAEARQAQRAPPGMVDTAAARERLEAAIDAALDRVARGGTAVPESRRIVRVPPDSPRARLVERLERWLDAMERA